MKSGIYRINLGNGWFYIGSSRNLMKRRGAHFTSIKKGTHDNQIMQRNWNKYGIFEFVVIESCEVGELLLKEQALLDAYFQHRKNANLLPTAGSVTGYRHSTSARKKMSLAHKKRGPVSDEARANMRASWKYRQPLPASARVNNAIAQRNSLAGRLHRERLAASRKGVSLSDARREANAEHLARLCKSNIGRVASLATRKKISDVMKRNRIQRLALVGKTGA